MGFTVRTMVAAAAEEESETGLVDVIPDEMQMQSPSGPAEEEDEDEEEEGTLQTVSGMETCQQVRCVCRTPEQDPDPGRFSISCDCCIERFHPQCVGLPEDQEDLGMLKFVCPDCVDMGFDKCEVYRPYWDAKCFERALEESLNGAVRVSVVYVDMRVPDL